MHQISRKQAKACRAAFQDISKILKDFLISIKHHNPNIKSEMVSSISSENKKNITDEISLHLDAHQQWLRHCAESSAAMCSSENFVCIPAIVRAAFESSARLFHAATTQNGITGLIKRNYIDFKAVANNFKSIHADGVYQEIEIYSDSMLSILTDVRAVAADIKPEHAIREALDRLNVDIDISSGIYKMLSTSHNLTMHPVAHGNIHFISRINYPILLIESIMVLDCARLFYIDSFLNIIQEIPEYSCPPRFRNPSDKCERALEAIQSQLV